MDLTLLDTKKAAEVGTKVELENPFTRMPFLDDEKAPYYIEILGGDSSKVTNQLRAIADRRLEQIQKTRQIVTESELARQDDIDTLAVATISWYLPPIDGQTMECTEANARALYADTRFPWIREHLEKVIGDRSRFFKRNSEG